MPLRVWCTVFVCGLLAALFTCCAHMPSDLLPEPGTSFTQALPAPSALKLSATLTSSVFRYGDGFEASWPSQLVTPGASHDLTFSPAWAGGTGGFDDLAFAIYAFDTTGSTVDDTLRLIWEQAADYGDLWIGLSDYPRDAWAWYPGPASDSLAYDAARHSSDGLVQVVVLCTGTAEWRLSSLRLVPVLPPQIDLVTPDTDLAGELAVFSATNSGGAVDTWSWTFGGGAAPNTSSTASPSVTLNGSGSYSGSVVATNICGTDIYNFILSVDPGEVHIFFSPAASGGAGTPVDAYALSTNSTYTFMAEDQMGTDITDLVTFVLEDESGGAENDPAYFDANVLNTRTFGFGTIRAVGIYHPGQPDEIRSDPDLAGEGRYFAVQ